MRKSAFLLIFAVLLVLVSFGSVSAWYGDYDYRIGYDTSKFTENQPFVLNGSNGIIINSNKQIGFVLYNTSLTDYYTYFDNETNIIVVANDGANDIQIPIEWEIGNSSSYNNQSVWDANYKAVWGLTIGGVDAKDSKGVWDCSDTGAPAIVAGKVGNALDFNGADEWLACGDIDITSTMTLEFWIYPHDAQGVSNQYAITKVNPYYFIYSQNTLNGVFGITYFNDSGTVWSGQVTPISDNAWHYWVGTYNGSHISAGLDGYVNTSTFVGNFNLRQNAAVFTIGAGNNGAYAFFDGLIDYVRISTIARSPAYINQTYQNIIGTVGYGTAGALEEPPPPSGEAPVVTAHVTSPTIVYPSTDFKFNMTITDSDNASIYGLVNFYVNNTWVSVAQTNVYNNTNTQISYLSHSYFGLGATLIAEYWASDGVNSTAKANQSTVTVTSGAPNLPVLINPANDSISGVNAVNLSVNVTDNQGDVMNVSFYNSCVGYENKIWNYQEYANVSTACGGLNNGTYYITDDYWVSDGSVTIDGNWTTGDSAPSVAFNRYGYLYINYTKPLNALNTSLWQIKIGSIPTENITIPSNCWQQSPLQFQIISFNSQFVGSNHVEAQCYNGSNWQQVEYDGDPDKLIYEEAMWWYINTYIGNATNIANGSTATYEWTDLADGVYNWYATVTDGYETNTSVVWTFSIDTTAPTFSNVGMNDTNVQINDTVLFYALWSDAVGDLNYSIFSWNQTGSWVNDSAVALIAWSNVTKTVTSAKVEYAWKIYANDSLGHWNNTGTQTFTMNNTAPTDPTDITGFPANLYVTNTLTVNASGGTDADGDTITYHYKFYDVNESAIRQNWSATNSYTIVVADAHDTIRVYAKSTTTDANSSGSYYEDDFVDDTIPTNPTDLTLTAGNVKVTDTLTGTCTNSVDTDGDTITYHYQFYNTNNTAERQAYSSDNTYVIAVVDAHDNIRVRCKATTNYGESSGYDEENKQIEDTLPTTPTGSSLTAGNVKVGETLTGTGAGSTDADSDAITYHYQFYNTNNSVERQAKSSDNTYVIVVADAHDNIRVRIWATTVYGDSAAYEELNKQIANTAPTQPTLTNPANYEINNTLTMNWTASTDADSDTINYWVFLNGTAVCYTTSLNCSYDPIDSYYEWSVYAMDGMNSTGSVHRFFTYDTVSPTITLNPSNAFTATNTSTINNYNSTSFPLNITFADERDLFAMEINITNATGYTMFNHTNTSLSGLSYTYNKTLNNTAWTKGLYTINITASDSHTSMLIGDYEPVEKADKLVFETPEANKITIEAEQAISSDAIKKADRYQFQFSYPKTKTTDVVYHIKSDNEIYYRPDSGYKAHFVIWNEQTKTGNWVDFEDVNLKDYTVQKVNDNEYTITFSMVEGIEAVTFNSIGGLNVVTKSYSWYMGLTSQSYTSPVLTNISTSFYLNATNTSAISDINARFFYNYTEYAVTKTTSADYGFKATATTPSIAVGTQNFNFTWNVSVNQTDGTQYNFSELKTQTVSTAQINVTIKDEIGLYMINNETFDVYVINEGRYYTTSVGYILIGNLSAGIPYIEIENSNYPRRGYYITISENLTTDLTAYILRSSPSTQEVVFTIQNSGLAKLENAKMTFYRMINMTYVEVGQIETDYTGQATLTLDTKNEYKIVIEAAGYPIKSIELRPIQTSYIITLQETGAGFVNFFEGIAYTITPVNRTFNVSQNYTNFRLDIYSSNSDLEVFGLRTFDHIYTCVPASCATNVTGSPSGGSAIVQVIGNTTGTIKVDVFFKRTGYDLVYLNYNIYSFVKMIAANIRSMWELRNQYLNRFSPIMLALIAIIGTVMLLGTAAEIGIYGLPLIVIAAFGLIFFAVIGFLNPLIVGLSLILGGIVYFRLSGGGDD